MSDVQGNRPASCETCMWWVPEDSDVGGCRRRAPSAYLVATGEGHTEKEVWWPLTLSDDFCGEWQPQAVKQVSGRDMLLEAVQPLVNRLRKAEAKDADLQDFMSVEVSVEWLRRVRDAVENEGQRS